MYNLKVLMTGSDGNCSLLQYNDTNILIDAGFKTKRKMEELLENIIPNIKIDGIIITHEHTDHFSVWTGRLAMENNIPLYLHAKHYEKESERKMKYLSHEDKRNGINYQANVINIKEKEEFKIKDLKIKPFTAYHDASKTLGFVFNDEFGYLTDCGYISNNIKKVLLPVKYLALEFNYNIDMLLESERHWTNKFRVLSKFGHLSNEEAFKFIKYLKEYGNLQEVISLHDSFHHNTHDDIEKIIKENNLDIKLHISERENNNIIQIG